MESLLTGLRAAAEPTRLRLLALCGRGTFCVMDCCDILGQSQPRLSRHLRLLCEAGLLDRIREGANVWFALPAEETAEGSLARAILARLPADDAVLAADRRQAARLLAERAREATETFRRKGAEWDEMRALGLPAAAVEDAIRTLLPSCRQGSERFGRLLDIGTGTGALLEALAPGISAGVGVDASRAMLALARTRLAGTDLRHCSVRLADMYRLPFPDAAFDVAVMQMVLHYADDPAAAIAEAARVLRPGGRLIVADLAPHESADCLDRLAHRWPGFADAQVRAWTTASGLDADEPVVIRGPLEIRLWPAALREVAAPAALPLSDAVLEDAQ